MNFVLCQPFFWKDLGFSSSWLLMAASYCSRLSKPCCQNIAAMSRCCLRSGTTLTPIVPLTLIQMAMRIRCATGLHWMGCVKGTEVSSQPSVALLNIAPFKERLKWPWLLWSQPLWHLKHVMKKGLSHGRIPPQLLSLPAWCCLRKGRIFALCLDCRYLHPQHLLSCAKWCLNIILIISVLSFQLPSFLCQYKVWVLIL